jgi:hypothetical protein
LRRVCPFAGQVTDRTIIDFIVSAAGEAAGISIFIASAML